jgi:hypothetical protein
MARVNLGWHDGKRRTKAIYDPSRRRVADALHDVFARRIVSGRVAATQ